MTILLLAQVIEGLNPAGWILMCGCIGFVCTLGAFCFWHILCGPKTADSFVPDDVDPRDGCD